MKKYCQRLSSLMVASFAFALFPVNAANYDNKENSKEIDKLVNSAIEAFRVPGVAIGVIENNKIIHDKGYGIADITNGRAVNKSTIFKIASNTKAFTTAALAILVERKQLNWDDKVVNYLPNFKMYDPWVTKEFNVRDLLTHRSGLRRGAGDLMLWPEATLFTRLDVIKNLRFLKPIASFRDQYAYDNLLYIVAGELISKISGLSWEDFVGKELFKPLAMNNCFAGGLPKGKQKNIVAPHVVVEGKLRVSEENRMSSKTNLMAAAGGIKCSVDDLLKWTRFQLNRGELPDGKRLFSAKQSENLWRPVTTLPLSNSRKKLDQSTYRAYALGWRISDVHGYRTVSHTGTLSGSMSQIILLPELDVGIVILTNQQSSAARNALARGLLQLFLPKGSIVHKTNWVDFYQKKILQSESIKVVEPSSIAYQPKANLVRNSELTRARLGRYRDPWFGDVNIKREKGQIIFSAAKSPRLIGDVVEDKDGRWWVRWHDRSFDADSWLNFEIEKSTNKNKLKMTAISDTADFSFDFDDLNFVKLDK